MNFRRDAGLLAVISALGACASSEKPAPAPTPPPTASAPAPGIAALESAAPAQLALLLQPLASATLPTGACGMILWTVDDDKVRPIFRYVSGHAGQIVLDGKEVELALVETDGRAGFGVFENLTFTSGAGLTVGVKAEFGATFEGGSWLQRGLVSLEDGSGWRSVAPAVGVAGCRGK
jgi:hypothetical protein